MKQGLRDNGKVLGNVVLDLRHHVVVGIYGRLTKLARHVEKGLT